MVHFETTLDQAFGALSDRTRRAILLRLGEADASISELAQDFDMTLTGLKKHVQILEEAGLVKTQKVGRVRHCTLGPQRLDEVNTWLASYRAQVEQRFDHLADFLKRTKGKT